MGKRILYLSLLTVIVIAAIILVKKAKTQDITDGTETVFVSISPLKFIVDRISGGDMNVEVMVPAGASPETYEPTPLQLRVLTDAPVIFTIGLIDFEKELVQRIVSASEINVVPLSSGINLLGGHCSHHNHTNDGYHHHHGGVDPHIWSSPRCLKTMSKSVYDALALLYPERAEKYWENLGLLLEEFDELNTYIVSKISGSDKKYFLIYHPALTYYAADYGIEQIVVEDEGKEPSLEHMKSIVSRAKTTDIKRIFYQREFSRSVVETLAADIEAEIVEIDPLAENVIANLRHITDLITE